MATRQPALQPRARAKVAPSNPEASKRPAAVPARRAGAKAVSVTVAATTGADPSKPKPKLVRDSFTIPKSEHAVLGNLKQRAVQLARPVKKSEILRAGIRVLSTMTDKSFLSALDAVPSLKTGRPKNEAVAAGDKTRSQKS